MSDTDMGKKVFFLFPPSVIRDEMIKRLIEQEYEVYMIRELAAANRLIKLNPGSIIFVNLDAGLSEPEWEQWIRGILAAPETKDTGIGILTYNSDDSLQQKYLMNIGIQCGFVKLKLGLEESTRILIATLKANEAKGRRKYVRAACVQDAMASINIREGPVQTDGKIYDISVVGLSCVLNTDPEFKKNSLLHDVQLKLRGTLIKTQLIVFGSRPDQDGRNVYVMLFTQNLDNIAREKIRTYIQGALQSSIEVIEDEPAGTIQETQKSAG